jgi:hypothetical protein
VNKAFHGSLIKKKGEEQKKLHLLSLLLIGFLFLHFLILMYCILDDCANTVKPFRKRCDTCLAKAELVICLDIDETLVSSNMEGKWFGSVIPDHVLTFRETLYKRPHLDYFLQQVFAKYVVCVWSAGTRPYIQDVVKCIFTKKQQEDLEIVVDAEHPFAFDRKKCLARITSVYTILIDDSQMNLDVNPPNQRCHVSAFTHPPSQRNDRQLLFLLDWLAEVANAKRQT